MSRIAATFAQLQAQGRKALIPFVTAGFPFADVTPQLMHALVAGGADVIELGVPFSDPSADGPVIQKAGDKALSFGIGLVQVLEMVRNFRQPRQHHTGGADGLRQPGGALQPNPWRSCIHRWLRTADGGYQPICAGCRGRRGGWRADR
jgi:hypothetical protein